MQRRGEKPGKGPRQKTARTKSDKVTSARASIADLEQRISQRTRELHETLQQQAATSEVLSIIRQSRADAQPVFEAIVESAARLCEAIFSVVYLIDRDRLRIAANKNFSAEATSQIEERPELRQINRSYAGGRAVLDRAIVHIPDVLEDSDYSREFALAGGWRAVLAIPLLHEGKSIGVVSVGKAEPTAFSDRQVQLLQTFADQAVIAIENARLLSELRRRTDDLSEALEQQTATSEVLKVISSSAGELEPVFETTLQNAVQICGATFGMLFRFEDEAWRAAAMFGVPPAFAEFWQRGPQRPSARTALGRIAHGRQAVHIADVTREPAYLEGEPIFVAAVNLGQFRTILNVPMLKDDELVGAIAIYRKEVAPFTDKQVELLTDFAAQAVIAIENAASERTARDPGAPDRDFGRAARHL